MTIPLNNVREVFPIAAKYIQAFAAVFRTDGVVTILSSRDTPPLVIAIVIPVLKDVDTVFQA